MLIWDVLGAVELQAVDLQVLVCSKDLGKAIKFKLYFEECATLLVELIVNGLCLGLFLASNISSLFPTKQNKKIHAVCD